MGQIIFGRPRASPPSDGQLGHLLPHIQLETRAQGILVSLYCYPSCRVTEPFNSLGTFSSFFIGDPVLHPMDVCEHPLLYCQALTEPLRRQLSQVPVSKLLLASTIGPGFGGCLWDGSPGRAVSGWPILQNLLIFKYI